MEIPVNACIRTSPRWDAAVRHLGYEPVDISPEYSGNLRKDTDIIAESQKRLAKFQIIPDEKLSSAQMASLELVRAVNAKNGDSPMDLPVYAAIIPGASDRVKTAGMYGRSTRQVYISPEQLEKGKSAIDTDIHELSHHTSGAEDGDDAHNKEMVRVAGCVLDQVSRGEYDQYLKNPDFVW